MRGNWSRGKLTSGRVVDNQTQQMSATGECFAGESLYSHQVPRFTFFAAAFTIQTLPGRKTGDVVTGCVSGVTAWPLPHLALVPQTQIVVPDSGYFAIPSRAASCSALREPVRRPRVADLQFPPGPASGSVRGKAHVRVECLRSVGVCEFLLVQPCFVFVSVCGEFIVRLANVPICSLFSLSKNLFNDLFILSSCPCFYWYRLVSHLCRFVES